MPAKRAACPAVPRAPKCGGIAAKRRHDRQHAATAAASPWRRRVAVATPRRRPRSRENRARSESRPWSRAARARPRRPDPRDGRRGAVGEGAATEDAASPPVACLPPAIISPIDSHGAHDGGPWGRHPAAACLRPKLRGGGRAWPPWRMRRMVAALEQWGSGEKSGRGCTQCTTAAAPRGLVVQGGPARRSACEAA